MLEFLERSVRLTCPPQHITSEANGYCEPRLIVEPLGQRTRFDEALEDSVGSSKREESSAKLEADIESLFHRLPTVGKAG